VCELEGGGGRRGGDLRPQHRKTVLVVDDLNLVESFPDHLESQLSLRFKNGRGSLLRLVQSSLEKRW
jgi:hypothetical protein